VIKALVTAAAAAALLAPAALATDPATALTADLQKLSTDRATMHAAVLSDIQKVTADAQSATKGSLRTTVKADIQALEAAVAVNSKVMQADRQQALADYEAAKAAHVPSSQLLPQYKQLLDLWQQDASDLAADAQAAQQAIAAVEAHLKN